MRGAREDSQEQLGMNMPKYISEERREIVQQNEGIRMRKFEE